MRAASTVLIIVHGMQSTKPTDAHKLLRGHGKLCGDPVPNNFPGSVHNMENCVVTLCQTTFLDQNPPSVLLVHDHGKLCGDPVPNNFPGSKSS